MTTMATTRRMSTPIDAEAAASDARLERMDRGRIEAAAWEAVDQP